jgi:plastocyanin
VTRARCLVVALGAAFLIAGVSAAGVPADGPDMGPLDPITHRGDQWVPKPPGTKEHLTIYFGPYTTPPGWDANRVDLNLPLRNGMVTSIEPGLRLEDGSEPSHQEVHLHHSHWLALRPGNNEMDTYTGGFTQWMFGNGDEETKGDSRPRSAAEPNGPIYGGYIGPTDPGPVIFMIHNKTAQPMVVYITLDVTFIDGTLEQLNAMSDRPYHNLIGTIFGRTFDVPRDSTSRDGTYETAEDDPQGVIEWTSPINGTLIGMGAHLHPGGLSATIENYGSKERPCPDSGGGYGGAVLLKSDALWRHDARFSEDFQMEVTHPAWRAPIHKGDRLRISGTYENRHHAWYEVMTHAGLYVDKKQPPTGRCKPYLVGRAAKRRRPIDPTHGVPNRPWGHENDTVCGKRFDRPCERPAKPYHPGIRTDEVTIANFTYQPGDLSLSGQLGDPVQVEKGTSLRFVNADQALGIRHTVTTCRWPCNGPYVANYPLADGVWDSGTLGYDPISGGSPSPVATTPANLPVGKYAYFCRIHPWMRGAFEVVRR